MKKIVAIFVLGFVTGGVATYLVLGARHYHVLLPGRIPPEAPTVCYACFWQGYDPKLRSDLIKFYLQYDNPDPLVSADVGYILWRATGNPNCDIRDTYRKVASSDPDVYRRFVARVILGFGGPECGQDGSGDLKAAAELAQEAGLSADSKVVRAITSGKFQPNFEDVKILIRDSNSCGQPLTPAVAAQGYPVVSGVTSCEGKRSSCRKTPRFCGTLIGSMAISRTGQSPRQRRSIPWSRYPL